MLKQQRQAAYVSASAEGATQIGLHIVVYDVLAMDLLRAGEACRKGDIEGRCSASNRALLLLGHLESWTGFLEDPPLVASLRTFYIGMRSDIFRLQAKGSPRDFERLSETVLSVRSAWQTKEQQAQRNRPLAPEANQQAQAHSDEVLAETVTSGWCA